MPKAIVAAIATLVTIGLTLVYAALDEQRFITYLPHAIRGSADAPPPSSLDERVLALETQVAQLAKLLTPTPVPTAGPSPTPTATPTPTLAVIPVYASSVNTWFSPVAGYSSTFTASISKSPSWYYGYAVVITGTLEYNGSPLVSDGIRVDYMLYRSVSLLDGWDDYDGSPTEGHYTILTSGLATARANSSGTFTSTLYLGSNDVGRIIPLNLTIAVPPSIDAHGEIYDLRYIELR